MSRWFLFLSIIFVVSCNDQTPKDILSIGEMQDIQWDLMRADELVEQNKISDSVYPVEEKRKAYYDTIFLIHHTNKDLFSRSLNYYTARPKLLKQILDGVTVKGEKMAKADTAKPPPKSDTNSHRLAKDTSRIQATFDSLKRKKLLKHKP